MSPLPTEPAAVWLPVDELKPWAKNPRRNADAVGAVVDSIKRFGFGAPVLARAADKQVIAGHTRLLAAKKLGLTHVPVRLLDLDPADAQLLALADNKLGEIAEWDDEMLGRVLAELKAEGAELAASGFDDKEIDRLLAELNAGDLADVVEQPTPEVPKVARSVRGEVYQLGAHRIMCGDSTNADDVLKLMGGERAALMATDPPYLVDYDGGNHPQSKENKANGTGTRISTRPRALSSSRASSASPSSTRSSRIRPSTSGTRRGGRRSLRRPGTRTSFSSTSSSFG
jgi:ParB-like chromosome segregation protein Spo0J